MPTVLSEKREAFCLLLVSGKSKIEAYLQSRPEGRMSRETAAQRANDLLKHPEILRRITELRAPATRAVQRKYQYALEHALHECDQAYALALALGQPSVMVSAIQVKARIAGLVVEKKEERHGLLDDATTRELLRMRAELRAREALVQKEVIDLLPDVSEKAIAISDAGGTGRFRVAGGAPSTLDRG